MMRNRWVLGALLLTASLLPVSAQDPAQSNLPDPATTVEGSGCVKAGVEKGCLVLTDTSTKTRYNLFFYGGRKPLPGTAIHFSGTSKSDLVSSCMQGKIVRVKEWTPLKMKCPVDK
jgi:hypothetical protein